MSTLVGRRGNRRVRVLTELAYGPWTVGRTTRLVDLRLGCGHEVRRRCSADPVDGFAFAGDVACCEVCG